MIFSKLIKWRKLIVCVIVILGVALYFVANHHTGHIDTQHVINTYQNSSGYIKQTQVIDKDLVIKTLQTKVQIVGLEGDSVKSFTYSDSIFQSHNWLTDTLGNRTLDITSQVFFKTGINISDLISEDSIRVYGSTLHIKLPHEVLINASIPFDKMTFVEKSGWLRSSLTLEQKQMLYSQIQKVVEQNIMSDESVKEQTYKGVTEALQMLLKNIPNCNNIVFSPRLD